MIQFLSQPCCPLLTTLVAVSFNENEYVYVEYSSLMINQRLMKTFQSLIDNRPKICYTISVIKLQIQPKEAIIMMNTYIYRIVFVSPAVCWTQGLYGFWCTSDLGCVFCLPEISFFGERIALCTRRGAFCFSWKALEYESNGKFSKAERRIFYDDRYYNTFEKWKRGCPWRD